MTSKDDLIRWSEALAGIARTGLGFTASAYEAERYEEILAVAADIRIAAEHPDDRHPEGGPIDLRAEWLRSVGSGVPGYVSSAWYGLMAPRGIPADMKQTLESAAIDVLKNPAVAAKISDDGATPSGMPGEAFRAFMAKERAAWGEVVKSAGLTISE